MNFSVKAPKEDPAVASARTQQQKQADAALTSNIQRDLQERTRRRLRRFGFSMQASPTGGSAGANLRGALPPKAGLLGLFGPLTGGIIRGVTGK